MTEGIASRAARLRGELESECRHCLRWAKAGHSAYNGLIVLAIGSSALAGVLGLGLEVDTKIVAAIALIPGISTAAGNQLRLQWRSMWHYRKCEAVRALLRRLDYCVSESITAQDVARIAEDFSALGIRMTEEWDEYFRGAPAGGHAGAGNKRKRRALGTS
jgi:hypothetical protein